MTCVARWTMKVHAYAMETGRGISAAEAELRFGRSNGNQPPVELLEHGVAMGFFRRQNLVAGGERQVHYFALTRDLKPKFKPNNHASYFTDLRRVNSVWQLGAE